VVAFAAGGDSAEGRVSVSRRQFLAAGAGVVGASAVRADGWPDDLRRWLGRPAPPALPGDLRPPAGERPDLAGHVLGRLTFGARPGDHARVSRIGVDAFIAEQLAPDGIRDDACARLLRHECDELADPRSSLFGGAGPGGVGELYEYKDKVLLAQLTRATLLRAVRSERQLLEVMTAFWTDHFNVDPSKGEARWLKVVEDRDVIRAHALGRFPELLRAATLGPAMLWYLDGRVNRRAAPGDRPNENHARELLELHTLGVHGGYTQEDVEQVARGLSGWTVRDRRRFGRGRVEFDAGRHDDGPKRILGRELPAGGGAEDLTAILDLLALHPSTARHLAEKLCRRFVADEPPTRLVERVAAAYLQARGGIRETLAALFAAEEFRDPACRGVKFKRPFHLVVSALRATAAETDAGPALVEHLLRMGHAPFRHATPEGYPEAAHHWESGLLWRWNFALALADGRIRGTRIDVARLRDRLGGEEALMASVLGRRPEAEEQSACAASGGGLALLLASPAFQWT